MRYLKIVLALLAMLCAVPAYAADQIADIACETTATTGTGTVTLTGALTGGYLSFVGAGVTNGNTVPYHIITGSGVTRKIETGRGVFTSPSTLTRVADWSTDGVGAELTLAGTSTVCVGTTKDWYTRGAGSTLNADFLDSLSSSAFQPIDADLTSWASITRASGFDTWATTPSMANLGSLLTDDAAGWITFGTTPTIANLNTLVSDADLLTTTATYVATVADGTGIDGTASGSASTYTPTLDLTEINSTTWGSGTFTTMTFDAGATDPVWTYSGSGAVALGEGASVTPNVLFQNGGVRPSLQLLGIGDDSMLGMARYANSTAAPTLHLAKSRGASVGTAAIVSTSDTLGTINFEGDDGTDFPVAASISAVADDFNSAAPGNNDMPGRLSFGTTADGATAVTERMRIDSSGNMIFGATTATLNLFDNNHTPRIQNHATNGNGASMVVDIYSTTASAGGVFLLARAHSSAVGTHTVVSSGDSMGKVSWQGANGSTYDEAGKISVESDAASGANDMPGRMIFATTQDAGTSPTDAMRITDTQQVVISDDTLQSGAQTAFGNAAAHFMVRGSSGAQDTAMEVGRFSSDSSFPRFTFGKSRNTTLGSSTVVQNGDGLGAIEWAGADGTDLASLGAQILVSVSGTPGTGDMPAVMDLRTSPDNAEVPLTVLELNPSVASAVNWVDMTNSATGVGPTITADGETNVDLLLSGKGTGKVKGVNEAISFAASDETTAIPTGTNKVRFRMPYAFTLQAVRCSLNVAQSSGGGTLFTVDINESGTSVISTKLTFDDTEKTTTTAATAAVISDTALADDAEMSVDVDSVGTSADAAGLKCSLIGKQS